MANRNARKKTDGGSFPIVGIGASAGGLEAFKQLLQRLAPDTGMAFVLVQHLDPVHESELPRLLARVTSMPIHEVTNDLPVQANNVYVIPPNVSMIITGGVLKLEPRERDRRPQHVIDTFFESLAQDQAQRAIGVVLSGTASDGTLGLEAIKAEGGFTFAQDNSAKYDSMPRNAIAAGCVDLVHSPGDIAGELARLARHPFVHGGVDFPSPENAPDNAAPNERKSAKTPAGAGDASPAGAEGATQEPAADGSKERRTPEQDFKRILQLLHRHTGVDFSLYKATTLERRVARRMAVTKHVSFADYERFLQTNHEERDSLYSDALISVTNFFRNPDAFDVLKAIVFPKLAERKQDTPIRVWVLGCSTGQEAYSLAMAYTEFLDAVPNGPKLQVFATDLNDSLLVKARAGLYAKGLAGDISPERLARFFAEEPGGYRVIKPLREMVVFARQNLISDPPFSRLDLISCRNLLIYLDVEVQKRIIPIFHYALKPGGFLFLGASESVTQFPDLFEALDKRHRIFAKRPASAQIPKLPGPRVPAVVPANRETPIAEPAFAEIRTEANALREADRVVLSEFAPPGVLIDQQMQVLQFRGGTGAYLGSPSGKATFDILKMVRSELMLPLREAINRAQRENREARTGAVRVEGEGPGRRVDIQVVPLQNLKSPHFVVLFHPSAGRQAVPGRAAVPGDSTGKARAAAAAADAEQSDENAVLRDRLHETERELAASREYLQMVQEQSDAATEELQAANEEAQSGNEELQSINEELQTSKEELESTNEELTTVNEELGNRNHELSRLNAELNNLHVSIHTAILVLGRDMLVRRMTPLAEKAFNLLPSDVGRRIGGIRHNLFQAQQPGDATAPGPLLDLEEIARTVIDSAGVRELEVQDRQDKWFLLRARPYMTLDNKVDGAVLALIDIDALKRGEQELAAALRRAEATFNAMRDPHLVLDAELRVKAANEAFYRTFQVLRNDTIGLPIFDLGDGQWNIPALRILLEEVLPRNAYFNDFEVTHEFERVGRRVMLVSGRRWTTDSGPPDVVLLSIVDVTERRRAAAERIQSEERFRLLAEAMPQKVFAADAAGEITYCNPQWLDYARLPLEQLQDGGWTQLAHPDDRAQTLRAWTHSVRTGKPFNLEHRLRRTDGEYRWHVSHATPSLDENGGVRMWVCATTDIHDVKESDQRKDEFLATLAHELRNPLAPMGNALQILRQTGGNDDSGRLAIDMMERQFAQAVHLMDDLLDVNRISRGKIVLHPVRMELATALRHAAESARAFTDRQKQKLAVELPAEPIFLDADPSRLVQIVGNLINNASKFSDAGATIAVSAARDGDRALIRVKDDGIGIAPNQLERIFDMFVQVDNSLERTRGGLGIGLTLVRKLVDLHGGAIEVKSDGLGKGAEFVVRLPAAHGPPVPATAAIADGPRVSHRILVVDDNLDSAESLSMLLRIDGHEVHVVHDGLAAVEAAAALEPDVVLLDIGLPRLNGYEAGRRIRAQGDGKPLTLIALTGWGQLGDRKRSKDAGFDFHLVKPVDPHALNEILRKAPGI